MKIKLPRILILLGVIIILARCGKESETSAPTSGSFASVYSIIRSKNCTECHVPGGAGPAANVQLDFTSQTTSFNTLTSLSTTGQTSSGNCGTVKIVKAGDPSKSYITGVLFDTYATSNFAGVSGCTPLATHRTSSFANFSSADQTSIIQWISSGAKND